MTIKGTCRAAGAALAVATASLAAQTPPADSTEQRGNTLVPLPVVFYQPETGTGFGVVTSYFFRLGGGGADVQPSAARAIAIYTSKRQIITQLATQLYTAGGRDWTFGLLEYTKFPTTYWGVGNDVPESAAEDYTPRLVQGTVELQRRIGSGVYLGFSARAAHREILEREDGGLIAANRAPGSAAGRFIAVGLLASRDTRNSVIYPRAGSFHQVRISRYDGTLGSSYEFLTASIDLRAYRTTLPGHVVAVRGLSTVTAGQPPFDHLAQLGGDVLLRGYYQGRFRDRHLLALEGEYRMPLVWRIGLVGFAGAGRVAGRLDAFDLTGLKTSAGGGLRFLLSPSEGLNIRADWAYGFAVRSGAFYLSLGEAY